MDLGGLVAVSLDMADGAEVDDDRSMNLRDLTGIELCDEILKWNANHRLAGLAGFIAPGDSVYLASERR